jgi:hypothetical protein
MSHQISKIKEKMLEFTRLFCLETSVFQRFVIIYKYIYFLNSDPLAKNIMQGIFDDTAKVIGGENCDGCMDEEGFLEISGEVLFSKEFWTYYSNLELIHKKMKKLKKSCIADKKEFDNFCRLFSQPYSKEMLELSFKVVNSQVFDRLDKESFCNSDEDENKTYFDEKKGILYVKGIKVIINKQNKITNAHKILKHIFITNKDNLTDDFYYAEIAEDEFHELDYKNRKNNWRKYVRACEDVNKKVKGESKEIKEFLVFGSGVKGKVRVNKKYF